MSHLNNARRGSWLAVVLAGVLVCAPVTVQAAAQSTQPAGTAKEASSDFGMGLFAVLANVVYMPVKVVYGVLGGVTGSLAYVLSGANREVADGVWVPSLGGDYVLTPSMMTGKEEFHFNGVRSEASSRQSSDEELGSTF